MVGVFLLQEGHFTAYYLSLPAWFLLATATGGRPAYALLGRWCGRAPLPACYRGNVREVRPGVTFYLDILERRRNALHLLYACGVAGDAPRWRFPSPAPSPE